MHEPDVQTLSGSLHPRSRRARRETAWCMYTPGQTDEQESILWSSRVRRKKRAEAYLGISSSFERRVSSEQLVEADA